MFDIQNKVLAFLVTFFVGFVVGMYIFSIYFVPEPVTKTKTEIKTEYVPLKIPVVQKEYTEVEVPVPVYVKDTIIKEVNYPINKYKGSERSFNGYLHYEIDVAGQLLSYKFRPDFEVNTLIPVNTITNTITNSYYKTGWFVGGGVEVGQNVIEPFVGVSVSTKKGWQLDYNFKLTTNSHMIGVKKRLF